MLPSVRIFASRRLVSLAVRTLATAALQVGSKNLDWAKLGFSYVPTDGYVRANWKDGKWSKPEVSPESTITISILSNALHYGQAIFEGLKAHHGKDGLLRVFYADANLARLNRGADRLSMPAVDKDLWNTMIDEATRLNAGYIPPYGQNGSLYYRPCLFGHGAQLGLGPAPEYTFAVVPIPVGPYYKTGIKAVDGLVIDKYDRAAPRGIGSTKAAGNYSADVKPAREAAAKGYTIALYLDAKEHKYVEEFSTSNLVGISSTGAFVTPDSESILPSVTNMALQQLAKDMGLKVEKRPVAFDELKTFKEVCACGTAVVITPLKSITRGDQVLKYEGFDTMFKLYNKLRAIQVGEAPDVHGWNRVIKL